MLADYIASKYTPARRDRDIAEIPIADVINVYLADVAPNQARPEKAAERCGRLLQFFGDEYLNESHRSDLSGLCRMARIERRCST